VLNLIAINGKLTGTEGRHPKDINERLCSGAAASFKGKSVEETRTGPQNQAGSKVTQVSPDPA
jgi:hypothetical protein